MSFYFIFSINLFIYFWLLWVFIAVRGLSLVAASGGYSSVGVHRLLIVVTSLCCGAWALGTRASVVVVRGLSSCSSGSRAQA